MTGYSLGIPGTSILNYSAGSVTIEGVPDPGNAGG